MSVPALVLSVVVVAILVEDAARRRARRTGVGWYAGWALAGFGAVFASVSFALGLLVLPLVVVLLVGLSRVSGWPASIGLVAGAGLCGVLIGALNLGEPHEATYVPWLVVGAAAATCATALYALAATRRE